MKVFSLILFLVFSSSGLRITEINPRPESGGVEWIELLNDDYNPINLEGVCYGLSDEYAEISDLGLIVLPGRYVVIIEDSSEMFSGAVLKVVPRYWKHLNNYSDTIILFKPHGTFYDTAIYNYKDILGWKHQSIVRSLENDWRISPESSPGYPNLIFPLSPNKSELIVGPLVFTPNGDGVDDKLCVEIRSENPASIEMFSFDGRRIESVDLPPNTKYYWNGIENSGRIANRGPVFVIAKFDNGIIVRKRVVLWR